MARKTYLVTGAAGFVGARFVESCATRGIDVISVDSKPYFPARPEHDGIAFGKIVDRDELFSWLKASAPKLDAVVHLGARADTLELNVEFLNKINLEYSKSLWNYAAEKKLPFVYASSAATYGDGSLGYDDDEALIPRLRALNPYGESKRLFDLWALEEERAGGTPRSWAGFKFFNVYGFGERHKKTMASVVLHGFDQIRSVGSVKLFKSYKPGIADGHQKRDFVFVEDVVDVLHFALDHPLKRGIYNLGTGQARAFLDLARAVFAALGKPEKIEYVDMPGDLRSRYQYFTQARMERLRGAGYSKAFTSLEDGILKYVKRLQSATTR